MLVVGVVAADLGTAGGAVQPCLSMGAKRCFQPVQHGLVPGGLCGGLLGSAAVERCQPGSVSSTGQLLLPNGNRLHHGMFLL